MSIWIDVLAEQSLAKGEHLLVNIEGREVAVFNLDGNYYAIADVCSHDGGELASGELVGDEIICSRHGARFCIKTGRVKSAPAYENIESYPVRVVDGRIQISDQPIVV
jgi:3-phenylpropionate/trans-cinnamate dioxygenase ferredoxin component